MLGEILGSLLFSFCRVCLTGWLFEGANPRLGNEKNQQNDENIRLMINCINMIKCSK